jgi:hypothetical protein
LLVEAALAAAESGELAQALGLLRKLELQHPEHAEGCRELRYAIINEESDAVAAFGAELIAESANMYELVRWYERLRESHYPEVARDVGAAALRIARQARVERLLDDLRPDFEDAICEFRDERGARHARIVAAAAAAPDDYAAQAALAWHRLAYKQEQELDAITRAVTLRPDAWRLRARHVSLLHGLAAKLARAALQAQNPHAQMHYLGQLRGFEGWAAPATRSRRHVPDGVSRWTFFDRENLASKLHLAVYEGQKKQEEAVQELRRQIRLAWDTFESDSLTEMLEILRWHELKGRILLKALQNPLGYYGSGDERGPSFAYHHPHLALQLPLAFQRQLVAEGGATAERHLHEILRRRPGDRRARMALANLRHFLRTLQSSMA